MVLCRVHKVNFRTALLARVWQPDYFYLPVREPKISIGCGRQEDLSAKRLLRHHEI